MIHRYQTWRKLTENRDSSVFDKDEVSDLIIKEGKWIENLEWTDTSKQDITLTFSQDQNLVTINGEEWTMHWTNIDDYGVSDLLGYTGIVWTGCEVSYTLRGIEHDDGSESDAEGRVQLEWIGPDPNTLDDIAQILDSDYNPWVTIDEDGKPNVQSLKNSKVSVDIEGDDNSTGGPSEFTMEAFMKIMKDYEDHPSFIDEMAKAWGITPKDIENWKRDHE